MKKLICLLIVSLVVFSCSKDILTDENPDLKKANVPIPFKGEMCMTYNFDVPLMPVAGTPVTKPSGEVLIPKLFLAGEAWLAGHGTHTGELQAQSLMKGKSAYLDMESLQKGKVVLVAIFEGTLYAANGDILYFASPIRIDATDPENRTITGTWLITGGSGKFENAIGSGILNGLLPCWVTDGTLEYHR